MLSESLRRIFRIFNRYFMVPMFRLGFGPFIGNPVSGYIMVLKTKGRRTGKIRFSPVNYAINNGYVYCLAGWGKTSDWYRNLVATPHVEMILPAGVLAGEAETVTDGNEKRMMIRQILKNGGFAGFFEGYNPYTITDELLDQKTTQLALVRIRATGLGGGAADPGGWLWILVWGIMAGLLIQSRAGKRR